MRDNIPIQTLESTHTETCATHELHPAAGPLRVNVIATTEEGTIAALHMAASQVTELGARINLIAAEAMPGRSSHLKPLGSTIHLERWLCELVRKAQIQAAVIVHVHICHDRYQRLLAILQPHSLVVVGGRDQWWSRRERKLANFLNDRGHHVLFAAVEKEERKNNRSHEKHDDDQDSSRSATLPHPVGPWSGHLPYWCRGSRVQCVDVSVLAS